MGQSEEKCRRYLLGGRHITVSLGSNRSAKSKLDVPRGNSDAKRTPPTFQSEVFLGIIIVNYS